MDALSLLGGDAQTFTTEVWASRVHTHRTDPSTLTGYLTLADVDTLLTASGLRTPTVRVVRDGVVLPPSAFTRGATLAGQPLTGLVDGRQVVDLHRDGATVVLQGLHRYWPPLTELVRSLEAQLGHPCQANAYLTPPGAQGFARHSDSHDVFVFQTHGTKQWTVDDEELLLEPGLCVYLPTGTPHSARSQADTSLHVTLGINRTSWREILRRTVDEALCDSRYDEPLPAGYLDDPRLLADPLADQLEALTKTLAATDPAVLADQHCTGFLSERPPALRGALLDLQAEIHGGIDDATILARRGGSMLALRDDGDRLRVLLGDRELRVPSRLRAALEFVGAREDFRVGDLPLDAASRPVLAGRLVREGLLRVVR